MVDPTALQKLPHADTRGPDRDLDVLFQNGESGDAAGFLVCLGKPD